MELTLDVDANESLLQIFLESSQDGKTFTKIHSVPFENRKGTQSISQIYPKDVNGFFRITLTDIYNRTIISPILKLNSTARTDQPKPYPNPFIDHININYNSDKDDILLICIMSASGASVLEKQTQLKAGQNIFRIETGQLPAGNYTICTQKIIEGVRRVSQLLKQ